MPSIQILYEADHQARATALMNSLANDANADPIDTTPATIAGLKTLIFWGHGNATFLCGKSGRDVVSIVNAWKKLNDKLETIEIITCNSRHYDAFVKDAKPTRHIKSVLTHLGSSKPINDSMGKQVKRGLKYSIYPSIRKIKVLSMPESGRGSANQYSILYWDGVTTTWCYVTGPTEPEMFKIGTNIKNVKKVNGNPALPGERYGGPRGGDFPTKLAGAKIDFPTDDYADVVAGSLTQLRGILVEVR